MQVQSLGGEDLLEEGVGTHSSILAWRISWTEEPGWLQPWCRKESDATEGLFTFPVQGPLWGSPKCTPCLPSPPVCSLC